MTRGSEVKLLCILFFKILLKRKWTPRVMECDVGDQNHSDFTNPVSHVSLHRCAVFFIEQSLILYLSASIPFPFHQASSSSIVLSVEAMGSIESDRTVTGLAAKDPSGVLSPYTYTLRSSSVLALFFFHLRIISSYFSGFDFFLAETPARMMFSLK